MNAPARFPPDPATRPSAAGPAARGFTVDEVIAMQAAEIIGTDERLELIEGSLLEMQAKLDRRYLYQVRLTRWFGTRLPTSVEVGGEPTLFLGEHDAPQPDLMLHPAGVYGRNLDPAQIHLVVEVADSALRFDLGRKAALYARFGVPEYWVVDVNAPAIHVHRGPVGEGWREVRRVEADEKAAPLAFPDAAVSLAELAPELL